MMTLSPWLYAQRTVSSASVKLFFRFADPGASVE